MAKILIVDDEINIIKTVSSILQDESHIVYSCANGGETMNFLQKNEVDCAIYDVWLPDVDGIELLEKTAKLYPEMPVIMLTGHGSIDIAVKSTKMGAFDFIQKPPSMERIITSVKNAIEQARLKRENLKLKKEFHGEDEMIGNSQKMKEIRAVIDTAASTNARVLITGDSGTGKELVARAIYRNSKFSDKPFIKVNCAAIPNELIESELFGHEKGSFTGATARRLGKFEIANRGTLFLDEISNMSLSAQAKVLRVLQEQQFERVGGNETINVEVRVLSATNVDIKKAIEEGRFREDLYFRLNVIPVAVPALAERREDIPLLVQYFLEKFSVEHGLGMKEITEQGMEVLVNHAWPGNIRELKNFIERISIMVPRETVDRNDIIKHLESYNSAALPARDVSNLKRAREDFEKNYIISALKQNERNVTLTAKLLGIERTNLHRKIKQYHIDPEKI